MLARDAGERAAQVELDYVFGKYRDFTPGEFVYRRGGPFVRRGYQKVIAPRTMLGAEHYLDRVGFRRTHSHALALELEQGPAAKS